LPSDLLKVGLYVAKRQRALIDVAILGEPDRVATYGYALFRAPQIFLGTLSPEDYSKGYLALITFLRLVAMGFFLSIIIKRFNRR
jgi:hypothetical protein